MLPPDTRTVAVDFLRPPPDYQLDCAVLTSFSLDLETLLALPLAALAHADGGIEEMLAEPLTLLQALREAGEKIHVFVDQAGIGIPRTERSVYAMLESGVHPVRAPNGGAFHPKVWIVRFSRKDDQLLIRVAVLSRNLTYDRCWDIALVSEAVPEGKRRKATSAALGDFLRMLPDAATATMKDKVSTTVADLAQQVERCRLPAPEGWFEEITFQSLGVGAGKRKSWAPAQVGSRLIAISPFLTEGALNSLAGFSSGDRILISRQDALDELPKEVLGQWDSIFVLSQGAGAEIDDSATNIPDGLHAKLIGIEHGWDVSWYMGSANITNSAFRGHNVEVMAHLEGRRSRFGIDQFMSGGFLQLCEPYRRAERERLSEELRAAQVHLEATRNLLLEGGALEITCAADEGEWMWTLSGDVDPPPEVEIHAWPVSLSEDNAQALSLPMSWRLPIERITAFVSFRLSARTVKCDDICFTLLLPARGIPEHRMHYVLRSLIDTPERFLRFLRALLGGLEGLVDWPGANGAGGEAFRWTAGLGGESLLEDLMRVASKEPARLGPVRRLIRDLRESEEGRKIVPDDLLAVWNAIDEAIGAGAQE